MAGLLLFYPHLSAICILRIYLMCAILPIANACATLERGVQAEQGGAVTDGAGIPQTIDRLGSVEARVGNIEA